MGNVAGMSVAFLEAVVTSALVESTLSFVLVDELQAINKTEQTMIEKIVFIKLYFYKLLS